MDDVKYIMNLGKSEWGIPGYIVAKTHHYINKSAVISPEKRKGPSNDEKFKAAMPDPTKYSDDFKKAHEKYWKKANGKFYQSKKINFLDEITKRSQSNPGPGSYSVKEGERPKNDITRHSPLGRFDKSEKLSFLSTVESYAQETPSCWKYASTDLKKKANSLRWIKPKIKKNPPKDEIGPGKYSEGATKALKTIMTSTPKFSFPKSKTPTSSNFKSMSKSITPGVGTYKESDKAYFKYLAKKSRVAVILPYRLKTFSDVITKKASQTPGPGAYEIIPKLKK